mmetsp:Transcript_77240/g.226526  ORF Transcript_77240/g.226526 Transcript_77240/m.226526 type:complete len:209 (+) Transcript_77240:264-890(+)
MSPTSSANAVAFATSWTSLLSQLVASMSRKASIKDLSVCARLAFRKASSLLSRSVALGILSQAWYMAAPASATPVKPVMRAEMPTPQIAFKFILLVQCTDVSDNREAALARRSMIIKISVAQLAFLRPWYKAIARGESFASALENTLGTFLSAQAPSCTPCSSSPICPKAVAADTKSRPHRMSAETVPPPKTRRRAGAGRLRSWGMRV